MRFEISRSQNGNKIVYIARDTNGIVRLRSESVETLQEAIKQYNDALIEAAQAKKPKVKITPETQQDEKAPESSDEIITSENVVSDADQPTTQDDEPATQAEEKKEFLTNEAKKQTDERRRKSSSKSFWDKLK